MEDIFRYALLALEEEESKYGNEKEIAVEKEREQGISMCRLKS